MKLRNRLRIAAVVMVVLPIALIIVSILIASKVYTSKLNKEYGINVDNMLEAYYATASIHGKTAERAYEEVKASVEEDSKRFGDVGFLKDLDDRLDSKMTEILVKRNYELIFTADGTGKDEVERALQSQDDKTLENEGIYLGGDRQFIIKKLHFTSAGDIYDVFLITEVGADIPHIRYFFINVLAAILLVLIIVMTTLDWWIYKSYVIPMNKLILATDNIKAGNYDFVVMATNDEFREVFDDFDEMREALKKSAYDLEKSDQEERELIRNISHDLKTPLTSIKGCAEGLLDGIANTPEKQTKYLKIIYNKSNDMNKLIDELTMFSKFATNRVMYNFVDIRAKDYFEDCRSEFAIDLEANDIDFKYEYHAKDDDLIKADPEQLKRVFNNIISNSVKYMNPDRRGAISLMVYDEDDYIHVLIKDNGKGIDAEDLPKIFERFYRTDSSRNSKQGGSGIGLAIVKKIIENHKGKIWAESILDEGTTMNILLLKTTKEGNDE